jgi:hypothetical protein
MEILTYVCDDCGEEIPKDFLTVLFEKGVRLQDNDLCPACYIKRINDLFSVDLTTVAQVDNTSVKDNKDQGNDTPVGIKPRPDGNVIYPSKNDNIMKQREKELHESGKVKPNPSGVR